MSHTAPLRTDCPARIFIAYPDGLHVVGCSADPGHPNTHTAYHADRLHTWHHHNNT